MKTSIITVANTVRLILNNPNIRVLIASSTLENAKNVLDNIKGVFWRNRMFRELFPDFCAPEDCREFGTQLGFTVPNRTDPMLREDTVEACGLGQIFVGRHYDYLILSDIVTDKSVNTKYTEKKTRDWCAFALSLLNNPATDNVIIEGTRYSFGDYYGYIEDEAKRRPGTYNVFKRPCYNPDGTPWWPERFTVEDLKEIEEQQSWIFAGQYLLEPIDSHTAPFKQKYLKYFDRQSVPRGPEHNWAYPRFMTIDPAISESKDADYSVMTVSMFDETNMEWVLDVEYGHWNINKFAEKFMKMYAHYEPDMVGIEEVAFQKLIRPVIELLTEDKSIIYPWQEIKRDTRRTKASRIISLVPRFEQGKIKFCDDIDRQFIESQILRFDPDKNNNKDDFLDTLADMDEIKDVPRRVEPDRYKDHPALRHIEWLEALPDERETEDWREEQEDVLAVND